MQLTLPEITTVSATIAKSGLFGVRTAEQACALMLLSQAEGFHPVLAARDYHVIQGRPTLKADAMLARYQQAGGKVEWLKYENDIVRARFTHAQSGSLEVEWTIEMAKRAGLTGKDVWKQYPRSMLKSRVISEGVRVSYPGVCVGIYTPEEVEQFDARPVSQEKPIKAREVSGAVEVKSAASVEVEAVQVQAVSDPVDGGTHPLDSVFAGHDEAKINAFLRSKREIGEGQTYRDLSAEYTARVLSNKSAFLAAALK